MRMAGGKGELLTSRTPAAPATNPGLSVCSGVLFRQRLMKPAGASRMPGSRSLPARVSPTGPALGPGGVCLWRVVASIALADAARAAYPPHAARAAQPNVCGGQATRRQRSWSLWWWPQPTVPDCRRGCVRPVAGRPATCPGGHHRCHRRPRVCPAPGNCAASGFRAVQSTPLVNRAGHLSGMLSTHLPQADRSAAR